MFAPRTVLATAVPNSMKKQTHKAHLTKQPFREVELSVPGPPGTLSHFGSKQYLINAIVEDPERNQCTPSKFA